MSKISSIAVATAFAFGFLSASDVRADDPYKPEYKDPLGVLLITKDKYNFKKSVDIMSTRMISINIHQIQKIISRQNTSKSKRNMTIQNSSAISISSTRQSAVVDKGFKCLIIVFNKYYKPVYRDFTDKSHWVATPSGQGKLKCEFEKGDDYGYDNY